MVTVTDIECIKRAMYGLMCDPTLRTLSLENSNGTSIFALEEPIEACNRLPLFQIVNILIKLIKKKKYHI